MAKAKLPLVIGGAAIAGAAGGLAFGAARGRKRGIKGGLRVPDKPKVRIKSKDLKKAAQEVGNASKEVRNFSAQVGALATALQQAREAADDQKHRSPIEVVLQGLTARR